MSLNTLQVIRLLTVSVGMLGCVRENSNYCKGRNPDDNCTEPVVCMNNSSCAAPTGVCDAQTMMCVQCTPDMASACTGTSPICGVDHSCHGCSAHSDCTASNVCLPDGSCITNARSLRGRQRFSGGVMLSRQFVERFGIRMIGGKQCGDDAMSLGGDHVAV